MVESLRLDTTARETFVLTGDIHHYERAERGEALHVIAGGGGAFLHPARIAAGGLTPKVSWPGVAQSRRLLRGVPWKLACGRSGFLPHIALLLIFAPAVLFGGRLFARTAVAIAGSVVTTIVVGVAFALLGGGARRKAVLPLALAAAVVTALIPIGASSLVRAALANLWQPAFAVAVPCLTLALAVFAGTFVFGGYLALLTLLGYEHMQAFTALDHPGFKHFVRLRVRADGSGIDAWCIGATDPLRPGQPPELVDHFVWRPFSAPGPPRRRAVSDIGDRHTWRSARYVVSPAQTRAGRDRLLWIETSSWWPPRSGYRAPRSVGRSRGWRGTGRRPRSHHCVHGGSQTREPALPVASEHLSVLRIHDSILGANGPPDARPLDAALVRDHHAD